MRHKFVKRDEIVLAGGNATALFGAALQLLAEREAYRSVAMKNYNAPQELTIKSIYILVDSEARRLLSNKEGD